MSDLEIAFLNTENNGLTVDQMEEITDAIDLANTNRGFEEAWEAIRVLSRALDIDLYFPASDVYPKPKEIEV